MTKKVDVIDNFKVEPYKFLSNFYSSRIWLFGRSFRSAEHAYQAMKATNKEDFMEVCKAGIPAKARKLGRKIEIRKDWDRIKVNVMGVIVYAKFSSPKLGRLLIRTYPITLVEGNTWKDRFWGVYRGRGKNMLGQILMECRNSLIEQGGIV